MIGKDQRRDSARRRPGSGWAGQVAGQGGTVVRWANPRVSLATRTCCRVMLSSTDSYGVAHADAFLSPSCHAQWACRADRCSDRDRLLRHQPPAAWDRAAHRCRPCRRLWARLRPPSQLGQELTPRTLRRVACSELVKETRCSDDLLADLEGRSRCLIVAFRLVLRARPPARHAVGACLP